MLREVLAEIGRQGTNLNQITRRANSLSDRELAREAHAIESAVDALFQLQQGTSAKLLKVVFSRMDLRLGRE